MNISPIESHNNFNFGAKKHSYYITRNMLKQPKRNIRKSADNIINKLEKSIIDDNNASKGISYILKELGYSHCEAKDNFINIGGTDGDFYQIKTMNNFTTQQAKQFIFQLISENSEYIAGLENYRNMIKKLGRQDIVMKGLKLHTYELNTNLSFDVRNQAAEQLKSRTNIPISVSDLFFVENEAFYYDSVTKTAYGVNLAYLNPSEHAVSVYRTCRFETDSKGKAIGYKVNDWDFYHKTYFDKEYKEQQKPSIKLPPVMEQRNHKEFAEAFRFGNTTANYKMRSGTPNVLKHLSDKAGFNALAEDLQYIKFYDNDDKIIQRIAYYNPATGYSFVYNDDGKYLYQLEYNKDVSGNIISCLKF